MTGDSLSDADLARLTDVFRSVFDDGNLLLHRGLRASDVPDWDSLMHVRLMLEIEQAFSIRFTALEIGKLESVGDLMDLIASKLR